MRRKPDFTIPMQGQGEVLEVYGWHPRPRYFVEVYTDGPATRWSVIDRQTQEWVRRFPTKGAAEAYATELEKKR